MQPKLHLWQVRRKVQVEGSAIMSAPQVPSVTAIPDIPEALAKSQNPVHKLSASMLSQGLDMLRGFYRTITSYNEVQSKSEELLKTATTDEVKRFQVAKRQASEADGADRAAYEAEIAPLKQALEQKIKARRDNLEEKFYRPALNSLNLEAGLTENDYGQALKGATELTDSLTMQINQLSKQGVDMQGMKLPKLSATSGTGGDIGFTPKFAAARITTRFWKDGEVQDEKSEDVPNDKLKNTDLVKRFKTTRSTFLQRLTSPWAGDDAPWRDAEPGFQHTFRFGLTNPKYDDSGNIQDGVETLVTVVKASRVKAQTPTGEIVEVDIPDPTDVEENDTLEDTEGDPVQAF